MNKSSCRFCESKLEYTFLDLGMSPLANSYVKDSQLSEMEPFFPLHVYVCRSCLLVQLEEYSSPDQIFSDYAYFSSYSDTMLQHAKAYTEKMTRRFNLDQKSQVVEIASNDGYLLQYFSEQGIPVLGIEPAGNVAEVAQKKGIPSVVEFFGDTFAQGLVRNGTQADLLIGNNVLAHIPALNDFVCGLKTLLKPQGVITMEFPHLMRLMAENQFDTIYHEHFSYFSFYSVQQIFAKHGLQIFDVDELPTHGGSLRIYCCHDQDSTKSIHPHVLQLQAKEKEAGFWGLDHYLSFAGQVAHTKSQLLKFLISAKEAGKTIAGYGAPAKGNTLLNYCNITPDILDYLTEKSDLKIGLLSPGMHIPVVDDDVLKKDQPDYGMLMAWNLRDEIIKNLGFFKERGGRFLVPMPTLEIV